MHVSLIPPCSVILVEIKGDPERDEAIEKLLTRKRKYSLYARDGRNAYFLHRKFRPSYMPGVRPPKRLRPGQSDPEDTAGGVADESGV